MDIISGIIVFILVWWVTLFSVLPIGIEKSAENPKGGQGPGAPQHAKIKQKLMMTTAITTFIWIIIYILIDADIINFYDIARDMSIEDQAK